MARIRLVKPDKATAIENQLINSAKRGSLPGPVQENAVVGMLEKLSKKQSETKITVRGQPTSAPSLAPPPTVCRPRRPQFKRRTIFDDEDEDEDDDV